MEVEGGGSSELRVCVYPPCDTAFVPYRHQVYCTPEHYKADHHRAKKARKAAREAAKDPTSVIDFGTCALDGCSGPARGNTYVGSFCTDSHYNTDWRRRTGRAAAPAEIVCALEDCTATFIPVRSDRIFCSSAHGSTASYRRNRVSRIAAQTARLENNPKLKAASRERAKQWALDHPEEFRAYFRQRTLTKRGLTAEGYDRLFEEKAGCCWICEKKIVELTTTGRVRSLHVDHDHELEEGDPDSVRGLLCTWCNTRLALLEDHEQVGRLKRYLADRLDHRPPADGPEDTHSNLGRWYKFGLTDQQFAAMRAKCGDRCEVCGEQEPLRKDGTRRMLSVEHDHAKRKGEPGFIRGLACNTCNSHLGVLENVDWCARATAYLVWAPPLAQRLTADCRPEPPEPRPAA